MKPFYINMFLILIFIGFYLQGKNNRLIEQNNYLLKQINKIKNCKLGRIISIDDNYFYQARLTKEEFDTYSKKEILNVDIYFTTKEQ